MLGGFLKLKLDLFENLSVKYDGILIFDSRLRAYFTGFWSTDGVLFFNRKEAFLFVDFRYFEMAKHSAKNCNVVRCDSFKLEFERVSGLKDGAIVAVASEGLFVRSFDKIKEYFKNLSFELSFELDEKIAMKMAIKTDEEISKIVSAQRVTDWVYSEILNYLVTGVCELEIARKINSLILSRADGLAFETIVVSGRRTSLPHGHASDKVLQSGDFIIMDFGAVVDGYCSDMTRTVCLGRPSSFQEKIYNLVLKTQQMAIDSIIAGRGCSEVDLIARNYFKKFGYEKEFGHGLGHGVGIRVHEQPILSPKSRNKFEPDNVITVEPGLYFPGEFGVRIEDLILVKKTGVVDLTKSPKNLLCL